MDYEKEIPFGAFDSELMHQEINIPEGFEATIEGNKIILKRAESDDEKIRKRLIDFFEDWRETRSHLWGINVNKILAWFEKQVPADEDEIIKGIRRGVAISLMNHIDANSKGMCLSNMECEDIENAIINEDWDKVYAYMKKKLEKQGECQVKESAISQHENKTCKENNDSLTSKDDMMIEETLYFLREYQQSNRCKDENGMQNSVSCEKWLKSLKERIGG